ncbi:hypothetical protein [Legionella spiritensis]|uniref:hypothetical protein n=1 Tax=Legionella spiritensis TaxID=452 RepID=UPI000F704F56|nr:hypothetical protein [Legionella spiritensis]VEG91132.1 Uncharacterised protein [Legionella spiritensis]
MSRLFRIGRKPVARSQAFFPKKPPLHISQVHTAPPDKKASKHTLFTKLKSEERKQFSHGKRRRSHYEDNCSAALALPYSRSVLEARKNDFDALLAISRKNLIEHANRRVDLFFYTLIAYYKTGLVPMNGKTDLQHGRGRPAWRFGNITEACHSSLTPSLLDNTIFQTGRRKHKSLIDGTHFMDSLNATVELPPFLNHFDDVLENSCRQQCLEILGNASLGKITPIEGLNIFLNMMSDTLNNLKIQVDNPDSNALLRHSLIGDGTINKKIIDLVLSGTLDSTFLNDTRTVSDAYLQLLLRVTPDEKKLCQVDEHSKETIYLKKIMEIREEILGEKSDQYFHSL